MIDFHLSNNKIDVSYLDMKGKLQLTSFIVPEDEMFNWEKCSKKNQYKDYTTWNGDPVRKKSNNRITRERVYEYLHHSVPEEKRDEIFNYNVFPKIYFIDIETEIAYGFPKKENPVNAITTISIVDEKQNCIVLGVKDLDYKSQVKIQADMNEYFSKHELDIKFKYIKFDNEKQLLIEFLNNYVRKMSAITGWNFIKFDWNYIVARSRFIGIDPAVCSISHQLDRYDLPKHKIVFDYLLLLKSSWAYLPDKASFKLDYIGETALDIKKIQYTGTLDELYDNDFDRYVMYNAVDSLIVMLLHRNYNAFTPYFKQAELTHVPINSMSSIACLEAIIYKWIYDKGIRPVSNLKRDIVKRSIDGGYVMKPITGFHHGVSCYDYASLYPTTIRQWNISPDVYIGMKDDLADDVLVDNIVTSSGAVFEKNRNGFYREILTDVYNQRREQKKIMKECDSEITRLKQLVKQKTNK